MDCSKPYAQVSINLVKYFKLKKGCEDIEKIFGVPRKWCQVAYLKCLSYINLRNKLKTFGIKVYRRINWPKIFCIS